MLPTERGQWTDSDGNPLPDPHADPAPPDGWEWQGDWYTPAGWVYAGSFAAPLTHWTASASTKAGSKSIVRRRRWERRIIQLSDAIPSPTTPRTPSRESSKHAKEAFAMHLFRSMLAKCQCCVKVSG